MYEFYLVVRPSVDCPFSLQGLFRLDHLLYRNMHILQKQLARKLSSRKAHKFLLNEETNLPFCRDYHRT